MNTKPLNATPDDLGDMDAPAGMESLRPSEEDSASARREAQSAHDDSVLDDFLDEDSGEESSDVVSKVEIRPMTLTTLDLLRKVKSPFATGEMPSEDDFVVALGVFFFIQSPTIPLREIIKVCRGPVEELENRAYEVMDTIPMSDMQSAFAGVVDYVSSQTSTMAIPDDPDMVEASGTPGGNS